jgi:hypothetical protein
MVYILCSDLAEDQPAQVPRAVRFGVAVHATFGFVEAVRTVRWVWLVL